MKKHFNQNLGKVITVAEPPHPAFQPFDRISCLLIMNIEESAFAENVLSVRQTALLLGLSEFSTFTRIQTGELTASRLPFGIIGVPISEVERLSNSRIDSALIPAERPHTVPSDNILGIAKDSRPTLARKGELLDYVVPDHFRRFTESEIQGYRAAFGSIWEEYFELNRIRKQLDNGLVISSKTQDSGLELDGWKIRSTLINLDKGDILLCQKGGEFAVIERFCEGSHYVHANGKMEILMKGNDGRELAAQFEVDARHTLEFMASNQVATAQKVIWEQFNEDRPPQLVAAISERCRLAAVPAERISEDRKEKNSMAHGIKI